MKKIIALILFLLITNIASADVYYIGKWKWNALCEFQPGCWEAPQKQFITGTIDLRSLPQQGKQGGIPEGWGIFSYSQPVADINLFNLSDNLDKKLTPAIKTRIQQNLGITIDSDNLRDALYEIITIEGDPTGQERWKPLVPSTDMKMKLNLGTEGEIKQTTLIPFVSREWPFVLAVLHEDYKNLIRQGEYKLAAQWLDYNEEQFGIDYRIFIPEDATVKLASLPHQTTLTEDWNCTSSDIIDCDLDWTELVGDTDIVTDSEIKFITLSGRTFSQVQNLLSSANHYVQLTVTTSTRVGGSTEHQVCARMQDDSNFYLYNYSNAATDVTNLFKRVAGTFTQLGSNVSLTVSLPDTIKIQVEGSNIKTYLEGVEKHNETDTAITGILNTGIGSNITNASNVGNADNFESTDLTSAQTHIFENINVSGGMHILSFQ